MFVLGAAGAYSFNLVGSLPGCEVLLLPCLPILLLSRGGRAFKRQYLMFYVLVFGWLLGTLIADDYNAIPLFNHSKGVARVVFFAFDFMALAILIDNQVRKFVVFALSTVVVMLASAAEFRDEPLTAFKFGGASTVIILALLASSYFYSKRRYKICVGIALGLCLLNVAYAFRSQVVIILVSSVLTLPILSTGKAGNRGRGSSGQLLKTFALLLLACGAAYLANKTILYAAGRGFFDESTRAKFEGQSAGKFGVLFGGRPETLVAIQAIRDRPIVGHGSFPFEPHYIELKQEFLYEYGYSDSDAPEEVEYPVIPTHSHLTMAWVESGILGGLLWIYILWLTIQAIFRVALTRPNLAPLFAYLLVNFIWDILYSPFGSVNRMSGAYLVLLSYHLLGNPAPQAVRAIRRTVFRYHLPAIRQPGSVPR